MLPTSCQVRKKRIVNPLFVCLQHRTIMFRLINCTSLLNFVARFFLSYFSIISNENNEYSVSNSNSIVYHPFFFQINEKQMYLSLNELLSKSRRKFLLFKVTLPADETLILSTLNSSTYVI